MNGCGMLTITDRHMDGFNTELVNYYNSGNADRLKRFLYDNAVIGIEY